MEQFGEDYPRIRLGIGPKPVGADLAAWVLSTFSKEEEKTLGEAIDTLPDIVRSFVMDSGKDEETVA
jgi:PTH1 family peptidyl-tRNA hydrolase